MVSVSYGAQGGGEHVPTISTNLRLAQGNARRCGAWMGEAATVYQTVNGWVFRLAGDTRPIPRHWAIVDRYA